MLDFYTHKRNKGIIHYDLMAYIGLGKNRAVSQKQGNL